MPLSSTTTSLCLAVACLLLNSVIADMIYGWGNNDYGQLGLGNRETPIRTPKLIPFYSDKQVASMQIANSFHFAALTDGTVYASGNNYYGCLGISGTNFGNFTTPVVNNALYNCTVKISKRHANAMCGSNLYGWGSWAGYVDGQASGIYPKVRQAKPSYAFTDHVTAFNVINEGVFVTSSNMGIQSAGTGANGKLGLGFSSPTPNFQTVTVINGFPIRRIFSSQSNHVCALSEGESLYCWGQNDAGQVGSGDTEDKQTPTLIQTIEEEYYISQVAYGASHTIALSCGGSVLVWGTEQFGVQGAGKSSNTTIQSTPRVVKALEGKNVVQVLAAANSNFARTSDNVWYTWGAGYGGILGTSSDVDVLVPTSAPYLSQLGINYISTGSSARSLFGWHKSDQYTTIQHCTVPLVNECADASLNDCSSNSMCINTDRHFKCQCKAGFMGDAKVGGTGCVDIDECSTSAPCVTNATCTNTEGSFMCACPAGSHGDGLKQVDDEIQVNGCIPNVDECATGDARCSVDAICTDLEEGYNCTCKSGYSGNGRICIDDDECEALPCGPANASLCVNLPGSYSCSCMPGYEQNALLTCEDIDECADASLCSGNATCTNSEGSYVCACNSGFFGDGVTCSDTPINTTTTTGTTTAGNTTGVTSNSTTSTPATSTTGGSENSTTTSGDATSSPTTSTPSVSTTTTTGQLGSEEYEWNTLDDANTIAQGDNIGSNGGSTITGLDPDSIRNTDSDNFSADKKALVGVFVGIVGLVIIVAVVMMVILHRRNKRQTEWV